MTLAAAVMTACRKEDAAQESGDPSSKTVNLTVNIDNPISTRATGISGDETDEAKVNSLQVFVFNGEAIDGYASASNAKSLNLGCTTGSRTIYAIANAPSLANVTSMSELLATVSRLGENATNLEMIGKKTEEIKADTKSVNVDIDRLASRIMIKKVTNALTSPALKAQNFVLKSMYLINVAADINYGMSGDYQISTWYNKMYYQSGNNRGSLTFDTVNETVAAGTSHETAHYFYAYPNHAEHSSAESWSARATMLVLKVQIGTILYNYPILLPPLTSNHSYEIEEIQITRPGNLDDGKEGGTDEQEPVQGKDCEFTIFVKPWTTITVTDGTTI